MTRQPVEVDRLASAIAEFIRSNRSQDLIERLLKLSRTSVGAMVIALEAPEIVILLRKNKSSVIEVAGFMDLLRGCVSKHLSVVAIIPNYLAVAQVVQLLEVDTVGGAKPTDSLYRNLAATPYGSALTDKLTSRCYFLGAPVVDVRTNLELSRQACVELHDGNWGRATHLVIAAYCIAPRENDARFYKLCRSFCRDALVYLHSVAKSINSPILSWELEVASFIELDRDGR